MGKAKFGVGDRVKGKETGKLGYVIAGDADGDPKVVLDGEEEAKQRFGTESEIVEKKKAAGDKIVKRSQSGSSDSDGKKKKKKKKKKSSSSSSPPSSSSESSRPNKRKSAFGKSTFELLAEAKRKAKKYKKTKSSGANAAL